MNRMRWMTNSAPTGLINEYERAVKLLFSAGDRLLEPHRLSLL